MKLWQVGGIVGGAIGLAGASAFILYPIIGALVGALTFQAFYLLVTKTELWQSSIVIGGLWGMGSFGYLIVATVAVAFAHGNPDIAGIPLELKVLLFPGWLSYMIGNEMAEVAWLRGAPGMYLVVFSVVLACAMGAMLVLGIGKLIRRFRGSLKR